MSRGRSPAGRILVLTPPGLTASIPDVFLELLDAGCELIFSGRQIDQLRIPAEITSHQSAEIVELPLGRGEQVQGSERVFRALRDGLRFFDEELADATWGRRRALRRLLKLAGHPDWENAPRVFDGVELPHEVSASIDAALREIERLVLPAETLVQAVGKLRTDAVLLTTRCTLGGYEADVIKTARELGIPSILLVWSWDNLSSKAVLHEHPDHVFVWNELQAREAVELHGVPTARVEIVGAPNFDRFFRQIETLEPSSRLNGRKTIVYVGSSKNVAPDEPAIFARWLAAVRSAADPVVRDAWIRVRPYPGGRPWRTWLPPDDPLVSSERWAKEERERLAPLLVDADVVVALNTSAEIEAAIAGRPVVTFRAGDDAPGQEGSHHFRYLLEGNGSFVCDSSDLDEHVRVLSRVLTGDFDRGRLREFLYLFVRPRGLEQPVSPLVASAIRRIVAQRRAVAVKA
jgi:hypothetical protein